MSASEVISVALRRYLEGELAEHGPKTSANAWPESCRLLGWSSPRSRGAGGSLGMTAQSSPQRHQIAPSTPPAPLFCSDTFLRAGCGGHSPVPPGADPCGTPLHGFSPALRWRATNSSLGDFPEPSKRGDLAAAFGSLFTFWWARLPAPGLLCQACSRLRAPISAEALPGPILRATSWLSAQLGTGSKECGARQAYQELSVP